MKTLAAEWADLLDRRPSFREALEPLGRVIEAWTSWPAEGLAPLSCTLDDARRLWSDGTPLLEAHPAPLSRDRIEPLLRPALDLLAPIEDVTAFTDAWDAGEIGPSDLLPAGGRIGGAELQQQCRLTQDALSFLAVAGLRPVLTVHLGSVRALVDARYWDRSLCPCCGAPAGFADLLEDGRRELACHLCDTRWTFARLACPLCGTRTTDDFVRLIAEGADEGYAIAACRACRGYIKEIDRRARWNAGPALVEDWGSLHLDLVAHRRGYWRPIPTLIQLTAPLSEPRR